MNILETDLIKQINIELQRDEAVLRVITTKLLNKNPLEMFPTQFGSSQTCTDNFES